MAVYIVTYDLNKPNKDYGPLLKAIRAYTHCYALKSAFFVDSKEGAAAIRDNLLKHIDGDDALYVMELQKHWAANRVMTCTKWLKDDARTWG